MSKVGAVFVLAWVCCLANAQSIGERSAVMDMAEGCRVKLTVPSDAKVTFGQELGGSGGITVNSPPRGTKLNYESPFYLSLTCHEASKAALTDGLPVRFDNLTGTWVKDMQRFFDKQVWQDELIPQDRKRYSDAVHLFEIRSVNSQGFAFTEDDLTGDERGRRRQMRYCLFHAQNAVCGEGTMALLPLIRRSPKNDLTSYALRILRSIEFLGDAGCR